MNMRLTPDLPISEFQIGCTFDPQEVVDWDLNEDRYSFPEPNILTIRSAMLLPDSSSNQ